jgi:hypothetical protein
MFARLSDPWAEGESATASEDDIARSCIFRRLRSISVAAFSIADCSEYCCFCTSVNASKAYQPRIGFKSGTPTTAQQLSPAYC